MSGYNVGKHNSDDLGFVLDCLTSEIVDMDEFKSWLYLLIDDMKNPPSYVFDLIDINEKFKITLGIHDIVGFTPYWEKSKAEERALDGIGYKRSVSFFSDATAKEAALTALENNAHIEGRFIKTFPFISL